MKFKPMLAGTCTDTSILRYPVLVSRKLDGIRAMVQGGILVSRTLKPIPNMHVQAMFKGLPEGLDGELIVGDPTSETCYRDTVSVVMSDDKHAEGIRFFAFDTFNTLDFYSRILQVENLCNRKACASDHLIFVRHTKIHSEEDLQGYETIALEDGYEGVMIRDMGALYKQGRSSEKQGWLLKLKRFTDMEATVIGMEELEHNNNVATTNALGRTERSSAKAGKVGGGTMGKLLVKGLNGDYKDVEFAVGSGFDQAQRDACWLNPPIGAIAKVKYFSVGCKDKPRHPIFLGFRDKRDM